jgi:hypothetical protein
MLGWSHQIKFLQCPCHATGAVRTHLHPINKMETKMRRIKQSLALAIGVAVAFAAIGLGAVVIASAIVIGGAMTLSARLAAGSGRGMIGK